MANTEMAHKAGEDARKRLVSNVPGLPTKGIAPTVITSLFDTWWNYEAPDYYGGLASHGTKGQAKTAFIRGFKGLREKNSGMLDGVFSQSSESAAKELARDFHGRDNKGVKEYTLASYYPKDLADLGILIELQVFADDDNGEYIPINFAPEHPDLTDDETNVVLAAKDKQLYFIGGDQEYDIQEFAEAAGFDWPTEALEKDEVVLGQVKAIAYFADKHHLEGPKEQKTGIPYQHEFAINEETGEQIGEYPTLVYCQKDKVFKLVGGSYEILPEGISG